MCDEEEGAELLSSTGFSFELKFEHLKIENQRKKKLFHGRFFFLCGGCLPTLIILLSYLVLGEYIAAQNRKLKAMGQVSN